MSIIFDGKQFAKKKEAQLAKKVVSLKKRGIEPKLVSFVDPTNEVAMKYALLKQKAAARVGAEVEIYHINKLRGLTPLLQSIKLVNNDNSIHGVMIQFPLTKSLNTVKDKILGQIDSKKDVDGLKVDSSFVPATVKAVQSIMNEAGIEKSDSIVVLGSKGEVGKRLVKYLSFKGYSAVGHDKETKNLVEACNSADVIISTTGQAKIVTAEMVKNQAVVIDVGYPQADVDFDLVSKKTRFITPVPGGVGPVTVVSLLENLVFAAS